MSDVKSFPVDIQTTAGELFQIKVNWKDTISSIKMHIQEQHGYPAKGAKLMFAGKILQDNQSVDYYNIKKFCVIIYVMPQIGSSKQIEEDMQLDEELKQKLLSVQFMSKQLRSAYFTPTDETFMDILDVNDDKNTQMLQKYCQEHEYDSDAIYYDLNDPSFQNKSNIFEFMEMNSKNSKCEKIYSLRAHIIRHYQENDDMIIIDDDEKEQHRYKKKHDMNMNMNSNTKGWDKNLNDGMSSVFDNDEKQTFENLFSSFQVKMKDKLIQHKELRNKIKTLLQKNQYVQISESNNEEISESNNDEKKSENNNEEISEKQKDIIVSYVHEMMQR
eukprot:179628_1